MPNIPELGLNKKLRDMTLEERRAYDSFRQRKYYERMRALYPAELKHRNASKNAGRCRAAGRSVNVGDLLARVEALEAEVARLKSVC